MESVNVTKLWIERFVIGLRLCPFAHFSFYNGTICYDVSRSLQKEDCLNDLWDMIMKMKQTKQEEISNSFLLYHRSLSFDFMLGLKEEMDALLVEKSLEKEFQTVVFHPDFQFGDETFHASGNFTNRSPLPMIHILRVEEVARAIDLTEDVEEIPFRNKRVLENLKIKNIAEVFDDDFMEKIKPYI